MSASVTSASKAHLGNARSAARSGCWAPHRERPPTTSSALVVKNATLHAVLSGIGYWADMLEFVKKRALRLEPLVDSVHSRFEVGAAFGQLSASGRRRPKTLLRMNAR